MVLVVSIVVTLIIAIVMFCWGKAYGSDQTSEHLQDFYRYNLIPEKQREAAHDAYIRIRGVLCDLRHQIHNLPSEWGLPEAETRFLTLLYCCIPSEIESLMVVGNVDRCFLANPDKSFLAQKYVGKQPLAGNERPLEYQDFDRAERGDYAASLYIAKVILSERVRNSNAVEIA